EIDNGFAVVVHRDDAADDAGETLQLGTLFVHQDVLVGPLAFQLFERGKAVHWRLSDRMWGHPSGTIQNDIVGLRNGQSRRRSSATPRALWSVCVEFARAMQSIADGRPGRSGFWPVDGSASP